MTVSGLCLLAVLLATPEPVIPPGQELYFGANVDAQALAECEWRLEGVALGHSEAVYRFTHAGGLTAEVRLTHPSTCEESVGPFCVRAIVESGDEPGAPCGSGFLRELLADGLRANPGRFTWQMPPPREPLPAPEPELEAHFELPSIEAVQFVAISVLLVFLLGALVVTAARERPWRTLGRVEAAVLLLSMLAALLLRLSVEPFPADMQLATTQGLAIPGGHRWAAAFSALLHLVFAVASPSVRAAALANVVLGTLSVGVVYAFVVTYFENRLAAQASAALLAFQPISIRYSASDSAHVLLTLALLLALLFTTRWCRRGGMLEAVQAAGWLAICAGARAEGVIAIAAAAAVVLGTGPRSPNATSRQLLVAFGLGLALVALPLAETVAEVMGSPSTASIAWLGALVHPIFLSPKSPLPMIALAGIGLATMLAGERRRAWLLLAIVVMAAAAHYAPGPSAGPGTYRQTLPSLALWTVVAGIGLAWLLGPGLAVLARQIPRFAEPARHVGVLVFAVTLGAPHTGFLRQAWSYQLEYAFFRGVFEQLEPGTTLVGLDSRPDHVGLSLRGVAEESGLGFLEVSEVLAMQPQELAEPAVFVESASCHARHSYAPPAWNAGELYRECRDLMNRFELEPIATTAVPALPYYGDHFLVDPIPLAVYRIAGPEP